MPVWAEDTPDQKLQAVENARQDAHDKEAALARQAEMLAGEVAGLRHDAVGAARAVQMHEAALTELEVRLAALTDEAERKARDLEQKRHAQTALLMAVERLARNPPEWLALAPGEPVEVLRSARLIGAAVPPLAARARELGDEIAALAALREEIARAKAQHEVERDALAAEQARIAALIARKGMLQQRAAAGARQDALREAQLAAEAKDLRDLIARLEAERKQREEEEARRLAAPHASHGGQTVEVAAPPPLRLDPLAPRHPRPIREAHGAMLVPASGTLVRRYGEADELGVTSKGLTIATRPGALVIAPFDGKIEFAGEFKGYGQILIIGHGGGYHSLLAGLDRADGNVGQWLAAGEPVGVMPGGGERPRLYFELRHNGQPLDPLPWLATRYEKVSG